MSLSEPVEPVDLPDVSGESLAELLAGSSPVLAAAVRRLTAERDDNVSYAAHGSTPLPADGGR